MSHQAAESKAPDSSKPRALPRGNDLMFEELEEDQVDYEESVTCEVHSYAASARSYGSTTIPVRTLRAAPPLFSRYEEDRRDPSVVTNDLDEAQSRQLFTESSSQRSWPGHSLFRRGAATASSLWILWRPCVGIAAAFGHLCVCASGRGGRSASATAHAPRALLDSASHNSSGVSGALATAAPRTTRSRHVDRTCVHPAWGAPFL
ncbi:hypothetical protein JG688_00018411 [Phytophthora aleatoria]|uniref:Uncharacterized protein n=1 Tax=Phytophthora aleatoria TaxID=2496075 RepID=A0A8J5I2P8_9STRA|nr:hypothetical protein JG688_00018411 [Phytophthora aleatoria]